MSKGNGEPRRPDIYQTPKRSFPKEYFVLNETGPASFFRAELPDVAARTSEAPEMRRFKPTTCSTLSPERAGQVVIGATAMVECNCKGFLWRCEVGG